MGVCKKERTCWLRGHGRNKPETAVICGLLKCRNPGMVWLEKHELEDYEKGEKIFRIPSYATKIEVEYTLFDPPIYIM
jgi:sugar (pentulose or hexulose) kinase